MQDESPASRLRGKEKLGGDTGAIGRLQREGLLNRYRGSLFPLVKRVTKRPRNDIGDERVSKNEGRHVNQRNKRRLG